MVVCGLCNSYTTGYPIKSKNKKYRYYGCAVKRYRRSCEGIVISELYLEKYLINNIVTLLNNSLDINTNNYPPTPKNNIDQSLINRKLKKLKDLYLNDLISLEEYKVDYNKYTKLLNSDADIKKTNNNDNISSIIDFFSNKNWIDVYHSFSNADKRNFWRKFIYKIIVDDKKNITVKFL